MTKSPPLFDPADFAAVRHIALGFPGAEDGLSHGGTPSVTVRGKLLCRLHDSGAFIPIRLDIARRDRYLEDYPAHFHLPEHFRPYPYICLWTGPVDAALLREVLELGWRALASKTQLRAYEARKQPE